MMCNAAVVDIGSNTIRMVAYHLEKQSITAFYEQTENAGLYSYRRGDLLDEAGTRLLVNTALSMKQAAYKAGCETVRFFATASLRGLLNLPDILRRFEQRCGLPLRLLSASEEAECDFLGLAAENGLLDFTGCDLGGGSAQIVLGKNGGLQNWVSLPLGCLRMANRFVKDVLPTPQELKALKQEVAALTAALPGEFQNAPGAVLHVTGGAARASLKLTQLVLGNQRRIFSTDDLSAAAQYILRMENPAQWLATAVPGRERLILPGIAILQAIAAACGCQTFRVYTYGVREGFVYKFLLSQPEGR